MLGAVQDAGCTQMSRWLEAVAMGAAERCAGLFHHLEGRLVSPMPRRMPTALKALRSRALQSAVRRSRVLDAPCPTHDGVHRDITMLVVRSVARRRSSTTELDSPRPVFSTSAGRTLRSTKTGMSRRRCRLILSGGQRGRRPQASTLWLRRAGLLLTLCRV